MMPIFHGININTNPLLVVHYSELIYIHKTINNSCTKPLLLLRMISCIALTIPHPLLSIQFFLGFFLIFKMQNNSSTNCFEFKHKAIVAQDVKNCGKLNYLVLDPRETPHYQIKLETNSMCLPTYIYPFIFCM